MTDAITIAQNYLALWNDADDASRRERLNDAWAVGARYVDPVMAGDSRDSIATMIAGAREQFSGHSFALAGTPDTHGDFVRFSWTLAPEGGAKVAAGTDVVRLNTDGHIVEVIGFIDGNAS